MKNPLAPRSSSYSDLPTAFVRSLRKQSSVIAIPSLISLLMGPMASAANLTWDPALDGGITGGVGTWDTTLANWYDGAADVAWPNLTTDTAVFGGLAGGLVTINTGAGVNAGNLTFNTTGYTLAGNVAADVLTLGTGVVTVTNGSDTATVSAVVGGTSGLTKAGPGTLVLSGVNTYTGVTNVNAGVLRANQAVGLGAGNLALNGGVLETGVAFSRAVGTAAGEVAITGGASGFSAFGAPVTVNLGGAAATLVWGSPNFAPTTLVLNASTANNALTFANGLDLNDTGAPLDRTVSVGANTATIGGAIINSSGVGGLVKSGAGALVLSGINTYSGATTINQGTLQIGAATALGDASATNTIALGGGALRSTATMDLGVNRTIAVGAGGGALSAQTGTVLTVSGTLGGTGTLSAAGGGTVVLSADNSGFGGNMTVDSVSGNTTNTTLRLSNANALTSGTITVNPGAAAAAGNGNQVDLAGVSIGSGVNLVLNTLATGNARASLFSSSGTGSWAGGIQLNGDGLAGLNAGTGATLNVGGNITGLSFTGIAFVRGAGTGNINGTINLPTGNLSKTDGGTWNINSTGNTWVNTGISVGTLRMGIANALPSATAVTLGQNDANNATLDLNGFSQTIGSLSTNPVTALLGTKTVTSAGAATLTINGATNTTYAGVISGASLALVKQGTGIQTLTGTNTFAGGTTIDASATLQLGDKVANALNLAAGTAITNNGTLIFAPGATNQTYNNAITGNGNITMDGAAASGPAGITLSGANTGFTGSYTITQGRLVFATQAAVGATTAPITVNGNATNGGQFWLNGNVTISNPITINGYGSLEASGLLGAVRFNTGTYAGAITVGSNASLNPQGTNVTISGNISGLAGAQLLYGVPGATAQNGNVTVTSPGGNTYAGGTLVRLGTGTLNANVANAVGTGTLRVESGTVNFNVANAFGTAPIQLSGGAVRVQAANSTVGSAGVNGLNGTYYNFGNNPGVASTQFATDQLYLEPRSFSRIDAQTNIPNSGSGTAPIVPVPGFSFTTLAGVSDGFVWKGLLNITNAGTYQFKGTNDDNLTLYIDGVQIGTIGVVPGLTNIGSGVVLSPGAHSIVIKQTQGGGGGYATVRYNGGAGSDAPTDELLGTDAGSITTGSLASTVIGPVEVTANSTLDIQNNTEAASLNLGNATLTVTSQTLDNLSVAGATISAATPTLTSTANNVLFNGGIGESSAGLGLNLAGGRIVFNAANTYTGTTTVTGGQLRLNKVGIGNAIAGNLTVNSTNAGGDVVNVVLLGNDQIADTSTVTMTAGILQLGNNNDTIGSLAMNGGRIIGNGLLTVTNLGTSTFTAGSIEAGLAGTGGISKTGTGLLALAGAGNAYTGITTVSNGILSLRNNAALGAGGAGNETSVSGAGQLQILSGSTANETINVDNNNGLRVLAGSATLAGLNYTAGATAPVLRVDGGELALGSAPSSTANITKTGNGTLTFNYDVGATLPTNVIHSAGALGFSGTQSFGAVSIPSGLAYKFNSDPGAGVNVTAPTGTTVIDGGNIPGQLLTRIDGASAGSLALSADSSANFNFTADPGLSLGAVGDRTYSGTITPGASGYRLGGGGGTLNVASTLGGANNLTINQAGTVTFSGAQNFTGSISIDGAGRLRTLNNSELGTASNAVTLTNGGTLETIGTNHNAGVVGSLFGQSGNPIHGARVITVGTGGGTINIGSFSYLGNFTVVSGANSLTGSGDLTKTGYGELIITEASNFSGNLTIAGNGGRIQLRSGGTMASVASLTIGQGAEFLVHNNGGLGARQFAENPGSVNNNRFSNTAPITLAGGSFFFIGNDAQTVNELESVGAITLNVGRNQIQVNKGGGTGTVGAQLNIADLIRPVGGGVLHIAGSLGTLGTPTGDHARVNPLLLNGAALPAATANGVTLPWATTTNAANFAGVSVTGLTGIVDVPSTNQAATTGFVPSATTRYTFNGAANAAVVLAAGNQQMAGLRFVTNNAGLSLQFAAGTDTLFLGDGVVIGDNNNQTRTLGTSAVRGRITSGLSAAPAGAKELFFHNNSGALAVESVIVNNNGAVTVHKGVGGGTLELRAANTYTGGTILHSGRINANVAGSLGTGSVTVKGAALELRTPGTITATPGSFFTISDQSELYLQSSTGVYNTSTDRFLLVGEGNALAGGSANANQSLASLTRVDLATFTGSPAGGQIVIPANTIIRTTNPGNGVVDVNMPANLGTNADLYFNISAGGGSAQSLVVGAGTPWKGLSTGVSASGWNQGTINANSDFYIQGLNRLGGNVIFNLGVLNTGNGYTINNLAGKAINAYIEGRVDMNEDSPISLPSDLTFVATPNSYLVPTYSQSFGADTVGLSRAKLLAQGGSTVDLGNFVQVGAAANQPQGIAYPIPSPLNAFATFESGSRLFLNDASGAGSTTGGATWTMKGNSVLHLGNTQAFLGSNSGLINSGQIVYEPGAIIRIDVDNIFKLAQFTTGSATGSNVVLEIYNGNRSLTDYTDPTIVAVPGTPTIVASDFILGGGAMLTNDSGDRQVNERRGNLILNDGAVLAATSQTYFNIQENISVAPGATLTIGSNNYVDGNPKLGAVQLNGPNSNVIPDSAVINMVNGSQLAFGSTNVWPDNRALNLPNAVTFPVTFGTAIQPGTGTSLLLNTGNFIEYTGAVTGNGAVMANAGGTALGMNITSDVSSNVVFKSTNGQNPSLVKAGPNTLTLTGASDSTGLLVGQQGVVSVTGTGNWGELRVQRGGTITVDNSASGANNRLGTVDYLVGQGGTFELKGHATTPVTEYFSNIASGAGGFIGQTQYGANSTIKITPGAATTTMSVQTLENFVSAGQRYSSYIINSPSVGNGPLSYGTANQFIPNGSNTANGLLEVFSPNFGANAAFGIGAGIHFGSAGTSIAASRNDFLGDANGDGVPEGFMTEDGIYYPAAGTSGTKTLTGLPTTTNLAVGMAVTGTGIPADTRIESIASPTSVTLTRNLTTAGANLNVIVGGMRNLAASEYTPNFRDNHNAGINVKLAAGTTSILGDTRVQTLTLSDNSTLNINGTIPLNSTMGRLHLNSGGVFVPSGATATINGGTAGGTHSFLQSNGGTSLMLHTWGTLNLNAKVYSDIAVVKTGPGTLNVGAGVLNGYRTNLQVDGGTVTLAPGNNLSSIRSQNGSTSGSSLIINAGTLDLNGNSQMINQLASANELPGMGGTITSSSAATITNTGGGRFAGVMNGAISLDKTANNTLLLTSAQTYTGTTTVRAGTLVLRDSAALGAGAGALSVLHATLQSDNGYLSNVANRINPATPVSLKGATFNLTGAAGQVASQTFNTLTLAGGVNNFTSNAGGGGANEVIIGNLVRANGSGAHLTFGQGYGFLGMAGNTTTAIRNFITNVNGSALSLNDNIIAGWAIATPGNGSTHFATYRPTTGVGALSNTGDGFANYESGDISVATATQNVNDGGAARTIAASKTVNAVRFVPGADSTWTLNSGVGLTIDTGGFISDGNQTHRISPAPNAAGMFVTSNTGELSTWVQQSTFAYNVPISGNIDLVKAGGAALNLSPAGNYTGITNTSGTNLLTTTNTAGLVVGMPISGTGIQAGSTITGITPGVSFTISLNSTAAVTAAAPVLGNTYTGKTIVTGGTLNLNLGAAGTGPRTDYVAVPGDLVIDAATVTEVNVANQISSASNVTISGGGKLNLVNAAGVTETLNSLTFLDGSSATALSTGLDRTALQLGSIVNLAAPTAITSTNTNPSGGVPFIGGFTGTVGFTAPGGPGGGSTLNINSPTQVNGVLAVGLRFGARIGSVPTGVTEGGLIKSGTGLLTLDPDQNPTFSGGTATAGSAQITGIGSTAGMAPGQLITGTNIPAGAYIVSVDSASAITMSANAATGGATGTITGQVYNLFGSPSSLTDVFNIQSGTVRADRHGSLGSPFSNTTVQSGAVLLGANSAGQVITGSVTLKDGSTLGATISGFTLGAATDSAANQTIVNLPSGTVNIAAYDYYVPSTNSGNITINAKLTGSGNINLVGQQLMQGNGGGGTLSLGNPLLSGAGAGQNNYAGTITVGTNAILQNQIALIAKNTAVVRSTGNALGSATINLNGGRLRFRDDATTAATAASNTVVNFTGINLTLSENSFLDAGRVNTADVNSGNTIHLGTLTIPSGSKSLTVDSSTATSAGAGLGNYITRFSSIDGAGTLVKAGTGRLEISAIAPGFTGGINIAGPQGVTVTPNFNTTTAPNLILPTTATVPNFSINGLYITEASKTLNVTGTLAVNDNPGSVATGQANVTGRLGVQNNTTVSAGTITNNGVIGPIGGAVTLTASTGFTGSGTYVTTNATGGVTSSQPLTLAGNVTSGTLRTAGLNTVSITGPLHSPTAMEVQSGTLKIAPAASAATSGTIRVFGSPASAATASTAPISDVTGTLEFAATGANSVTHTGNITNSGLVKVSTGSATVNGTISGSAAQQYVPGLLEGLVTGTTAFTVDNTRPANPGNFGIQMEPRMLQNNSVTQQAITGHIDNEVWVYTGYVKDDDGVFSFAGNQDDNLGVWIDGTLVLNQGGNVVGSTAYKGTQSGNGTVAPTGNAGTPSQNFGAGISIPGYGSGWHLVEIRMRNGSGGAGPWGSNGFLSNYGFGYKNGIGALDGSDYIKPIDDGTGSLFLTALGSKGNVQVDASSVLAAQGITLTNNLTLASAATGAQINLTGTSASDVDNLITTGIADKATVKVNDAAGVLTVNNGLTLAAGTTLKKDGPGTVKFYNATATNGLGSSLELAQGTAEFANNALSGANVNFSGSSTLSWKLGNTQDISSQIQPIPTGVTASFDTQTNIVEFSTGLTGDGSINKTGTGTLKLNAANSYMGTTSITGGTLLLGSDNVIPSAGAFSLSGGKLSTGGLDATSGPLSLTTNSVIDFGSATSILTFSGNTTATWTGILSIWNWNGALWESSSGGNEQLNFTSSSLTAGQLATIQFYSDSGSTPIGSGADFLSGGSGELVPVPEPSAMLAALLLLGAIGYRERRTQRSRRA